MTEGDLALKMAAVQAGEGAGARPHRDAFRPKLRPVTPTYLSAKV